MMKVPFSILCCVLSCLLCAEEAPQAPEKEKDQKQEEQKGIIGQATVDGMPIIYKFVNEEPAEAKRKQLPWLTVISWKYDGKDRNGMPPQAANQRMITLEKAIEDGVEKVDFCEHAYSRTGNHLKEFAYYIHDRDSFIKQFNEALKDHARYPIEIKFYKDPEWKDFNELRKKFIK